MADAVTLAILLLCISFCNVLILVRCVFLASSNDTRNATKDLTPSRHDRALEEIPKAAFTSGDLVQKQITNNQSFGINEPPYKNKYFYRKLNAFRRQYLNRKTQLSFHGGIRGNIISATRRTYFSRIQRDYLFPLISLLQEPSKRHPTPKPSFANAHIQNSLTTATNPVALNAIRYLNATVNPAKWRLELSYQYRNGAFTSDLSPRSAEFTSSTDSTARSAEITTTAAAFTASMGNQQGAVKGTGSPVDTGVNAVDNSRVLGEVIRHRFDFLNAAHFRKSPDRFPPKSSSNRSPSWLSEDKRADKTLDFTERYQPSNLRKKRSVVTQNERSRLSEYVRGFLTQAKILNFTYVAHNRSIPTRLKPTKSNAKTVRSATPSSSKFLGRQNAPGGARGYNELLAALGTAPSNKTTDDVALNKLHRRILKEGKQAASSGSYSDFISPRPGISDVASKRCSHLPRRTSKDVQPDRSPNNSSRNIHTGSQVSSRVHSVRNRSRRARSWRRRLKFRDSHDPGDDGASLSLQHYGDRMSYGEDDESLSRQTVSLKVIVHLKVNRGYDRDLESSINKGIYEREFSPILRYLRPTGKIVSLRDDKPRDILQAFCDEILQSSTTAVFHLVNPFFHSRSWSSAQYVSNLLSTLDMPVIMWGPEYIGNTDKKESDNLQLNISPTLHHQAHAMLSVLRHYNWTDFSVVYTPDTGHDAFITAVRILVNDINIHSGRNGFKFNIIDEFELSNATDPHAVHHDLKRLSRSETRIILLYCIEGLTITILDEATKVGLMTDEYLWFLTFEAINKNKLQIANNLPLGILGISYDYREAEMKHAIETAVLVWLKGLQQSVLATVKSDGTPTGLPWSMPKLECQSSNSLVWPDGPKFYEYLRNVSFDAVAFNELGQLKYKDIFIVNVQPGLAEEPNQKWRQVGMFTADGIQMQHITWPNGALTPPSGKPKRHFLRIVTREEPPFVEYRELSKNGTCGHFSYLCHVYERDSNEVRTSNTTVERCCTGLSIDFLHRLALALNFEIFLYEVEDYQWGIKNSDGTWNGIVGDLTQGKADMAVASMTIDEDRSTAINFSLPYMETGITFMVSIREGAISATAFLEPYDYPSWCLILVCSVHVTGTSIFLFEWFSPYGLDHGRRMSSNYKFSLFRTFWLMWAMLFGAAVTTDTPRGVSSKFMSNIWALFALVFSASYTANLAAFMITKEEYYDLSGMQDWRLQKPHAMSPPFRFGTIANGTTENNIKKINPRMYEYMKKYTHRSVEQAMDSLKTQKLHAFIYDASVLEYQEGKDKDCRLITVGNWYATTGYGVGFPFRSPWLDRVNNVILSLQNEGEMERLKEFWLAGACHTKRKKTTNNRGIGNGVSSSTLGILNFTSAFILLAAGTGLAVLTLVLEQCYFRFARKRLRSWDKKGCCALVSLSMGMSLSFQASVREAVHIHKNSKHKCKSPLCETKLWKARFELRQARNEIDRLQTELARYTLEGSNNIVWKYDPGSTLTDGTCQDDTTWGYAMNNSREEDEAARVTLL